MSNKAKIVLISAILILILIISYKIYAPLQIQNFNAVNLRNIEKVQKSLKNKKSFSFAVLGNIKNSITIFDKKILPKIYKDNLDFIISSGNNVVDSGEGKYRVLYRTLSDTKVPFITGVGENEVEDEGYKNYYKYFGPFYFSFKVDNSYFIFLDTTDHSPKAWQKRWLKEELKEAKEFNNCFVIMNKPVIKSDVDYLLEKEVKYIQKKKDRNYYKSLFSKYDVTAVFSSNLEIYKKKVYKEIPYFITGGAGGAMILDNSQSFYHYLQVNVTSKNVTFKVKKISKEFGFLNPKIAKFIENAWISLQSFMFTNYTTALLVLVIGFMIVFIFYLELRREVDYYREFSSADNKLKDKKLKIAVFTNNFFPFVGGVPISIKRLTKGLRKLNHEIYIFAPEYPDNKDKENSKIIRCENIFHKEKNGMQLPIVNIFSKKIEKRFKEHDFDIVHSHHPIWLGSKGLALAEKYQVPRIFTYHTRLEKYSHYLPGFGFIKKLFENRIAHYLIKRAGNRSDVVFAPTETAKEYLYNIGISRHIEVLPTGVDFDDYSVSEEKIKQITKKYKKEDEVVLLSVSRLSKEKNMYFLMKALKYIKENTDLNFRCLILGDGSEKENLKEYIIKNNLSDYIQLIGEVEHKIISRYYMMADLFVFASKSETQGMVLLEAMAGKTPVVAVRSSGIDDVIKNGYNGYKVSEDIKSWSQKVIKLIENKKLLSKMSKNAYKYAKNHSIKQMAAKAVKIYNKTINYEK